MSVAGLHTGNAERVTAVRAGGRLCCTVRGVARCDACLYPTIACPRSRPQVGLFDPFVAGPVAKSGGRRARAEQIGRQQVALFPSEAYRGAYASHCGLLAAGYISSLSTLVSHGYDGGIANQSLTTSNAASAFGSRAATNPVAVRTSPDPLAQRADRRGVYRLCSSLSFVATLPTHPDGQISGHAHELLGGGDCFNGVFRVAVSTDLGRPGTGGRGTTDHDLDRVPQAGLLQGGDRLLLVGHRRR